MPQALPPPPSNPLIRPAIIELRYETKPQFDNAVDLYKGLLSARIGSKVSDSIYAFTVGLDESAGRKDLLLRLVCQKSTPILKPILEGAHTIVYWKVPGKENGQLTAVDEALQKRPGAPLNPVEKPNDYLGNSAPEGKGQRSLLVDGVSGSLFGLTINPPVPTVISQDDESAFWKLVRKLESHGLTSNGSALGLLLFLLAGTAFLGWALYKAGFASGWKRSLQQPVP
jgi:hypothetical protein